MSALEVVGVVVGSVFGLALLFILVAAAARAARGDFMDSTGDGD